MHRNTRIISTLAVAGLVTAVVAIGPGALAQSSPARTLRLQELEQGSTFVHIRNTKTKAERSNSQGDLLAFTNPLANATGARVGLIQIECVTTTGASNFLESVLTCTGVVVLHDGTLTLQASSSPGVPTTTGAITGGTGVYANARGVFVSKEGKHGSQDTITIAN